MVCGRRGHGRLRCYCSCNGAAAGRGGRHTVLRPCLQHCKAAPQPRETGQKKRKCPGVGVTEREMEREERARGPRRRWRWERDRTERERQGREGEEREKEEVCIRTRHLAIVAPGRSGMCKSPGAFFSSLCYITNSCPCARANARRLSTPRASR